MNSKFKYGEKVIVKGVGVGEIRKINAIFSDLKTDFVVSYEILFNDGRFGCFYEEQLQIFDDSSCETSNKSCCDVQRNVTVEEVEKLEEELRRKDSELRDLKELIIKLLFDRYGF